MLSELLSMQLAFLLLFVYNRGVIKQQSGDGDSGMRDHAETIHLNVNSPVPFCRLRLRERDGKEIFYLHGALPRRHTGFTVDDPEKRVAVHNAGKGAKYTKGRLPVRLVWYREWNNGHDARSCEFYLKRKTKQEKEALAASFGKDTD